MQLEKNIFSLYELTSMIRKNISDNFENPYWVKAELVKLNYYPQSGHCYPELVEKENNKIKAQVRGIIWRDDYLIIKSKFQKIANTTLTPGMQLLFQVQISYSPLYGLSLMIFDIDPTFTIGALAYEKQNSIKKLMDNGVIDNNKKLPIPILLQKLAIISADSSKGYNDFIQTINGFKDRYSIITKLYHAILQGDAAIPSQISALEIIKQNADSYDAVLILRGGGGEIGMNCYNNYQLAYEIATFPIPVITGIGHSTDNTIVDITAAVSLKTPTETANYVLASFQNFENKLNVLENNIVDASKQYINNTNMLLNILLKNMIITVNSKLLPKYKKNFEHILHQIYLMPQKLINNNNNHIDNIVSYLSKLSKIILNSERQKLDNFQICTELLDPKNIMKRGYSITYCNNKTIKNLNEINEGDIIETHVYKGIIKSITTKIITDGE